MLSLQYCVCIHGRAGKLKIRSSEYLLQYSFIREKWHILGDFQDTYTLTAHRIAREAHKITHSASTRVALTEDKGFFEIHHTVQQSPMTAPETAASRGCSDGAPQAVR